MTSRQIPFAAATVLLLATVALAGCVDGLWGGSSAAATPLNSKAWRHPEGSGPQVVALLGDPAFSGQSEWPGEFAAPVTVADIDEDGDAEYIGHSADRHVYVYRADGHMLARLKTHYPPAWHIDTILNPVAAATLEGGKPMSIIATNPAGYVTHWRYDPESSSTDQWHFDKVWQARPSECSASPSMDAGAVLADLDGDGAQEVLIHLEQSGLHALETDGSPMWQQCWGGGNSAPVAGDLDGDGDIEAVFASDAGFVSVLDGASGNALWTYDLRGRLGIMPASVVTSPTLADVDGDGNTEVLLTARYAPVDDPTMFAEFNMVVVALHQSADWKAELVWASQPDWANPMSNTPLVVSNASDETAIYGMDWNTIGHFPGEWEKLGPAHVFRLDEHGRTVWSQEIEAWWSNKNIMVTDADGDQEPEVLAPGVRDGEAGLWRLDAADGELEGFLGIAPWKFSGGPIAAPPASGEARLAFPVRSAEVGDDRSGIMILDLGTGGAA